MDIPVSQIFPISNPRNFKIHLATTNDKGTRPLDVYARDRSEWKGWNTWKYSKNVFNRDYIFSLIDFYPESNIWLFGGVFQVLSRSDENYSHSYKIQISEIGKKFVGRLKIKFQRPSRTRSIKLENYLQEMVVSELLKNPYRGERFSGYEDICLGFNELENIIKNEKKDWKASLENIKGIYLINDKNNGKSYVGSAYGDHGIWSRWKSYIETGHGWNDEFTKIINAKGIEYARQYFQFILLEFMPARTGNDTILNRESFWKEALLSRTKNFGYNKN